MMILNEKTPGIHLLLKICNQISPRQLTMLCLLKQINENDMSKLIILVIPIDEENNVFTHLGKFNVKYFGDNYI